MTDSVLDKTLFDYDAESQRVTSVEEKDGKLIVHEQVPKAALRALIESNKREYNSIAHKSYKSELRSKNMWRAASIPNIIIEKWKREEHIDVFKEEDWPKVQAKLNSDEFKFLRTSPGKI